MLVRNALLLALVALSVTLAACGGDDKGGGGNASTTSGTATEEPAAPQEISKDTKERPKVPKPTGEPPSELRKEDLVKGDGKTARKGDNVTMQYVGVNHSTGDEFDASWNRNEPFTFTLGAGQVIPGWDEGIVGMKEGGRRVLTIPPDLGYGAQGQPPTIPPDETLVFVVDLVKVQSPR